MGLRVSVAAAVIGAPLWAGSAHPPATVVLAGVGALALACAAGLRERSLRLPPMSLLPALMALLAAAQLVPLSRAIRSFLDPTRARLRTAALVGLGLDRDWAPLTADVPATLHQVVRLSGLVALGIAADRLARSERSRFGLAHCLVIASLLVALVPVLDAMGFTVPAALAPAKHHGVLFSFPNANHAASLFAMVLPLFLVKAAAERRPYGWGWLLAAAVTQALLLATASRAGIVVGSLGAVVTMLFVVRRHGASKARRICAGIGAAAAAAMALVGGTLAERVGQLGAAVDRGQIDRLTVARDVVTLVRAHLAVGVGRGAFPFAFLPYSTTAGRIRFLFAENEYLQVLADFGVIGVLVLVLGTLIAARWVARSWSHRGDTERAAAVGLVVLAVHNIVDFSWETGGVAAGACALAALCLPGAGPRLRRGLAWALVAVVALLCVLANSSAGRTADADREAIAGLILTHAPASEIAEHATAAWTRHPADGYLADLTAEALLRVRPAAAFDWIERALAVWPADSYAHLLAARGLALVGNKAQAASELAAGFSTDDGYMRDRLAHEAVATFPDPSDALLLASALGRSEAARAVADLLAAQHRWDELATVAHQLLERGNDDPAMPRLLVGAALRSARIDLLPYAIDRLADAETDADRLQLARAEIALGRLGDAERVLEPAIDSARDEQIAILFAGLLVDRGASALAGEALAHALARAVFPRQKAALHNALADVAERSGNANRAEVERREAARWAAMP